MKLTKDQEELITAAIGQASMCWDPRPGDQVFDSEEAIEIVKSLINKLNETMECPVCKSIENRNW